MSRTVDLISQGLGRTIHRLRRNRQAFMTERSLGALPEYLRKDIGWPGRMKDIRGRD